MCHLIAVTFVCHSIALFCFLFPSCLCLQGQEYDIETCGYYVMLEDML